MHSLRIKDSKVLEDLIPKWRELAENSTPRNPFFEHWMLLPAIKYLAEDSLIETLVVFEDKSEKKLLALFPLETLKDFRGLPFKSIRLWRYIHCFLCHPLIRNGYELACIEELMMFLKSTTDLPKIFVMNHFCSENSLSDLDKKLSKFGKSILETKIRGFHKINELKESSEKTGRPNVSKRHYKDLKRKERRLSEKGNLDLNFCDYQNGEDWKKWLEGFLDLEASGWKGKTKTAFKSTENNLSFINEVVAGGVSERKFNTLDLRLNGEMIATQIDLRVGEGLYNFKIAFDENYKNSSPGMMLEFKQLDMLVNSNSISWMDTCTEPVLQQSRRSVNSTRELGNFALALRGFPEGIVMAVFPTLKKLKALFVSKSKK